MNNVFIQIPNKKNHPRFINMKNCTSFYTISPIKIEFTMVDKTRIEAIFRDEKDVQVYLSYLKEKITLAVPRNVEGVLDGLG